MTADSVEGKTLDEIFAIAVDVSKTAFLRDSNLYPFGLVTLSDGNSGQITIDPAIFGSDKTLNQKCLAMVTVGRASAIATKPYDLHQVVLCSPGELYPGGDRNDPHQGLICWAAVVASPAAAPDYHGRVHVVIKQGATVDLTPMPPPRKGSFNAFQGLLAAFVAGFQSIRSGNPHLAILGTLCSSACEAVAIIDTDDESEPTEETKS